MKQNKILIVVAVILSAVVLSLGGYLIYDKAKNSDLSKPSNNEKTEDKTQIKTEDKNIVLSESDKINDNKKLEQIIKPLLTVMPESMNDLKNKTNLIGSKKDKMKFLWELILIDDSINKDKDSRETGSFDVNVSDFIKEYKDIYNEVITENDISKEYTIKNGVIYGSYTTGFIQEFVLKAEEINKLENGNYQLKISLIAALDENGNSNLDTIEKYKSNEVLSYPENVKYGNLLIEYNKSNNVNYLVNITFEK